MINYITSKDKIYFYKQLSVMLLAGTPIVAAISNLAKTSSKTKLLFLFEKVASDLAAGLSLSRALSFFPKVFKNYEISLIRAGEQSGDLSQNLSFLAEENKKITELKRKIFSAVLYPTVISIGALGITLFLLLYVFPKVLPIFASFNKELPLSTKAIIALSSFLASYFLPLSVLLGIVFAAFIKYVWALNKVKYTLHRIFLRAPFVGYLARLYLLTNIARLLAQLLSKGIPIVESLRIVSAYVPNLYYAQSFKAMAIKASDGSKFSASLAEYKDLYPLELVNMVASGESSGNLADVLAYISSLYEDELNGYLDDLPRLIEPVLLLFTGLVVGFIALAIIQPIYGIVQSIKP